MAKHPWYTSTFARTALPMFGFVVLCWYGLDQLMTSKLKIRQSVRGYDKVEEYDPIERLRRLEGTTGGAAARSVGARGRQAAGAGPGGSDDVKSLEAELEELKRQLGDINKFDYKPVPRQEDYEP